MNYTSPYPPFPPPPFQGPLSFYPPHGPPGFSPPGAQPVAPFPGPPGFSAQPGPGAFPQQFPSPPAQWSGNNELPPPPAPIYQQGLDGWLYLISPHASLNHFHPTTHPSSGSSPSHRQSANPLRELNWPLPQPRPKFHPTPPETPPKAEEPPLCLPKINDYWKGRIVAPLHSSSPSQRVVTLSTHPYRPVAITKPTDESNNQKENDKKPTLELLPPRLYPPLPNPDSDHVSDTFEILYLRI